MGFAIIDADNVYAGVWSRYDNPPRPLAQGEQVIEVEWDEENQRPVGVTMPPEPVLPDWSAFRIGLEDDPAYLRVIASDAGRGMLLNLAVERLHALSGDAYLIGLAEVARLWNKIVTALQTPLTQEEIDALNALGTTSNVPFALNASGLLS